MFISSFNSSFDSTTEWLRDFTCSFLMQYMAVGHSLFYYVLLLSAIGVSPNDKVRAVKNFQCCKDVKGFLGLVNFYGR